VRVQLVAFRNGRVWLALAITALAFGAVYAPFTYIAPLMTEVAGFSAGALPWLLSLFGLGLVLGNVIGARAADRRLMATILAASVAMLLVLLAFAVTAHWRAPATITLFGRTCWPPRRRCPHSISATRPAPTSAAWL
jgi:DHA1 family inner membrane transport protein